MIYPFKHTNIMKSDNSEWQIIGVVDESQVSKMYEYTELDEDDNSIILSDALLEIGMLELVRPITEFLTALELKYFVMINYDGTEDLPYIEVVNTKDNSSFRLYMEVVSWDLSNRMKNSIISIIAISPMFKYNYYYDMLDESFYFELEDVSGEMVNDRILNTIHYIKTAEWWGI